VNSELLSLVEQILGKGSITSDSVNFHCPNCGHHKKKLSVELDESSEHFQKYQCWICGDSFKGKGLPKLFKRLGASKNQMNDLFELIGKGYKPKHTENQGPSEITLPQEFKTLTTPSNTPEYKHALVYATKTRRLTKEDIIRYNIGYCESGKYKNTVIVPSYDSTGKLNFFVGRNFYKDAIMKHMTPTDSSKDIVGFEMMINWNIPIILCEGAFDAIAIKRNAIPLFGKALPDTLVRNIIINRPPKVYLCLDNDAIKTTIKMAEKLLNEGVNVYVVDLPEGRDPSELGFQEIWKLIENTEMLKFSDLIQYKLISI